ncbi:MAG: S8 family serine peptidase [Nitrospira sp. SB0677_bin_15]|nr:S8 family serine peptidase [Nitrospira sp. SB0667_bin_9]MYG40862.1 S8 family serine peptidase [Nitrospira sp. SB0677_bin_15]
MLVLPGCGGGSGGPPVVGDRPPPTSSAPATPNPVGLTFRQIELGTLAPPDGRDYRTPEFLGHYGLDAISADAAYQRGYFGQNVTIAVADDGMDLTHPDLAGKIVSPHHLRNRDAHVFEPDYGGDPGEGHGTYVALLAAGARGEKPGVNYEITISGGTPISTGNIHGVAPQASVMPIQLAGGGHPMEAVRYAVENQAHVLNFSIAVTTNYYGEYAGRDGIWLTTELPVFTPLLDRFRKSEFAQVANTVKDADIVMVWAGGNEGWNSVNNETHMCGKNFADEDGCEVGEGSVTAEEFMENFRWLPDPGDPSQKISFKEMWGTACGRDNCIDYNSPGGWKVAPLFQPELLGKWLVVGALNKNGEITGFSNGCGEARNWCLMAPGEDLAIGSKKILGTSFAAPMVSGALAVLKSRLPSMPMDVVQAALLFSAEPLGIRKNNLNEPDPVYGWGRLNLANAVTMQGMVRLPYSVAGTAQAVALRDAHVNLSPALAHVGERMQAVEIAVAGVGSAYYNMKLSGIVDFETASPRMLGYAAVDMLSPASGSRVEHHGLYANIGQQARDLHAVGMDFSANLLGRWRLHHALCDGCERSAWREWNVFQPAAVATAPFFARAGGSVVLQMQGNGMRPFVAFSGRRARHTPWRQFGLQWRHVHGDIDVVAEFSRIDESRSVWGANFGALGGTRTETNRSQLLLSGPLGRNWRGFASYEHNFAEVSMTSGMLSGISGLRAEGWSAGTQGRNIFRDNDTLRFSVRQETRVRDGQARINHLVAAGSSFVDAFYRGRSQSLKQQQTAIDLSTRPMIRYSLGYALSLQNNSALAFGMEYEDETRNGGISTQFRMDF